MRCFYATLTLGVLLLQCSSVVRGDEGVCQNDGDPSCSTLEDGDDEVASSAFIQHKRKVGKMDAGTEASIPKNKWNNNERNNNDGRTVFELQDGDPCGISADKACIWSPNYPSEYGDDEDCNIRVVNTDWSNMKLNVSGFRTESGYDILTINGVDRSGSWSPPADLVPEGRIVWDSDYSSTKKGWKMCAESTAPSTVAPTAPPAVPPVIIRGAPGPPGRDGPLGERGVPGPPGPRGPA